MLELLCVFLVIAPALFRSFAIRGMPLLEQKSKITTMCSCVAMDREILWRLEYAAKGSCRCTGRTTSNRIHPFRIRRAVERGQRLAQEKHLLIDVEIDV